MLNQRQIEKSLCNKKKLNKKASVKRNCSYRSVKSCFGTIYTNLSKNKFLLKLTECRPKESINKVRSEWVKQMKVTDNKVMNKEVFLILKQPLTQIDRNVLQNDTVTWTSEEIKENGVASLTSETTINPLSGRQTNENAPILVEEVTMAGNISPQMDEEYISKRKRYKNYKNMDEGDRQKE